MTASGKKKRMIRIIAAVMAAVVLVGGIFIARKIIDGRRSVAVTPVMYIADTWIDGGSYGYGQISQGGTQQVWNDSSMLISRIYVSEGDRVSKGDALMQYDVTQARLQEDSCRIEYEMAQRDLDKAKDRLAYIKTFRPNERPEPLRMIYEEPVDLEWNEKENKLEILSGKASVEEWIKDGVYGITINVNPDTPITRRTFETLLSYDENARLPEPDVPPAEGGDVPREQTGPADPAGQTDPAAPGESGQEGGQGQEGTEPGGDTPEEDGRKDPQPQRNFTFVIWDHYEGMDSVKIATVSSRPDENGLPRQRWLETVLPREKEKEEPEGGEGKEEDKDKEPAGEVNADGDKEKNKEQGQEGKNEEQQGGEETVKPEPVYCFFSVYAVDGMSGSITEKIPELEKDVFTFSKLRANVQVPEPERYSRREINTMLAEQSSLVRSLEIDVSQANLDWKKAKQTATDGVVRAAHDGVVTSVGSPYSGSGSEPLIQVSSADGYQMVSTISEYQLSSVHVGDEISVTMWSNGMTYSGRIIKISPYPASNNMSYSYGSGEISYYQYTAELDCEDELQPWDGGEVQMGGQSPQGDVFAIQASFLRDEGGRSYVMKAGEDGRLVKQFVETGRILYGGWTVEILGGLTLDDYIAFPYGKNAVEGAKVDYDSEVMW